MIAIANGGLTGSGVGAGNGEARGYLPLAHSDFIFAVIAEELGFVGVIAVLGGFVLLAWFGIQVALAAPDRFGMLARRRHRRLVRRAGDHQRRRRDRADAGHRPDAAVLLGRRQLAVRHDGRRRAAAERGPQRDDDTRCGDSTASRSSRR